MKTLFLILTVLGTQNVFAQAPKAGDAPVAVPQEAPVYFNHAIAERIQQSVGPISREQLLGRWRKVIQGPADGKLGYKIDSGIREGAKQEAMEIEFLRADLDWLPKDAGVQLYAVLDKIPQLGEVRASNYIRNNAFNVKTTVSEPTLLTSPVAVALEGERAVFKMAIRYSVSIAYDYGDTERNWLGVAVDVTRHGGVSFTETFDVAYSCGLQDANPDRMICRQEAVLRNKGRWQDAELFMKEVAAVGFKGFTIGFTRVK
jgi:hypothetical protein